MSLSVGILGLPNVGKSTLFRALTKNPVDISNYPFCTIEPNVGIVEVADQRLEKLAETQKPKKVVPAVIKFVDVAGLVKGASLGEGLGNQFLGHLRECDALVHIVRCFKTEEVSHIEGMVNPARDIQTVENELILKDLETVEKRLQKLSDDVKRGDKKAIAEVELLQKIKPNLEKKEKIGSFSPDLSSAEKEILERLFLLTTKPLIYLLNCSHDEAQTAAVAGVPSEDCLFLDLREELDKSELSEEEKKEFGLAEAKLENLIKKCYNILELITFFTVVGKEEARAWPLKKGSTVFDGAGKIHSDFQEKFIKAEVINWQKLVGAGGWKKAHETGLLKQVGRDYVLEDGDVVEIKNG